MNFGESVRIVLVMLMWAQLVQTVAVKPVHAWSWTPSDEEMRKYRNSWNPFSHGPILHTAVDIQPKGQSLLRPFIFSQIGEHSFDNRLRFFSDRKSGPVHLYSVQEPSLEFAYGLTDHIQFGATTSLQSFWARDNGKVDTDTGPGDTSLAIKYRPIVQDPDSWRPSVTLFNHMVLPTGKWMGTSKPPGGFAPIGRFPATRFGEVAFTEGVMARKNIRPFRIQAGVFYTYAAPGSEGNETTYTGDLVNTRVAFEHIAGRPARVWLWIGTRHPPRTHLARRRSCNQPGATERIQYHRPRAHGPVAVRRHKFRRSRRDPVHRRRAERDRVYLS